MTNVKIAPSPKVDANGMTDPTTETRASSVSRHYMPSTSGQFAKAGGAQNAAPGTLPMGASAANSSKRAKFSRNCFSRSRYNAATRLDCLAAVCFGSLPPMPLSAKKVSNEPQPPMSSASLIARSTRSSARRCPSQKDAASPASCATRLAPGPHKHSCQTATRSSSSARRLWSQCTQACSTKPRCSSRRCKAPRASPAALDLSIRPASMDRAMHTDVSSTSRRRWAARPRSRATRNCWASSPSTRRALSSSCCSRASNAALSTSAAASSSPTWRNISCNSPCRNLKRSTASWERPRSSLSAARSASTVAAVVRNCSSKRSASSRQSAMTWLRASTRSSASVRKARKVSAAPSNGGDSNSAPCRWLHRLWNSKWPPSAKSSPNRLLWASAACSRHSQASEAQASSVTGGGRLIEPFTRMTADTLSSETVTWPLCSSGMKPSALPRRDEVDHTTVTRSRVCECAFT
mmetsp:Transcript_102303/g.295948  ORF Transcript_102303/g.295948 Transcript_102303/m.295948 type:complete len:464 (-) Transcript_102303:1019-2410(-)